MKRLLEITADLGLVVVSVYVAILILRMADALAAPFVHLPPWPGPDSGLLFPPGNEETHEMINFTCTARINALGIRDNETGVNKACHIRAVAIGDSFTYGWGVNLEDTWCKRLESNLRKQGFDIEILDCGKPGTGPEDYCRMAECVIPRLKPDIVIVGMTQTEDLLSVDCLNPISFLKDNFQNLILLYRCIQFRRLPHGSPLIMTAADVRQGHAKSARELAGRMSKDERARLEQLDPEVKEAFFAGRLNPWQIAVGVQNAEHWTGEVTPRNLPARIRGAASRFRRIKETASRYGAQVIVVCVPQGFTVCRESITGWSRMGFTMDPAMLQSDEPDQSIAEVCRRAGIEACHTVTKEFRKHIDETGLYFQLDQHMTAAGQALFADSITPMIAEDIRKAAALNPALASGRP